MIEIPDFRKYTLQDVTNFIHMISFTEQDKVIIIRFLNTIIEILKTTKKGAE